MEEEGGVSRDASAAVGLDGADVDGVDDELAGAELVVVVELLDEPQAASAVAAASTPAATSAKRLEPPA